MAQKTQRNTAQKISLFRRFFTGLKNVYGTYDPATGRARQVKQPVTNQVLLSHLLGRQPYGVYLLVGGLTTAVAVDIDTDDLAPAMDCVEAARQYGISGYIERSKSKGYHVWVFLTEAGVSARKARLVIRHILDEIGLSHTEVFPKHDRLDAKSAYGNFINAPLFGRLVPQGKTVFLDPKDPTKSFPNQWDLLESVQRVEEQLLEEIIEINDLDQRQPIQDDQRDPRPDGRTFGLPPCAQTMLTNGVTSNQRVACFRLAINLKLAGVPDDMAVNCLAAWSLKNRPTDGKRIITHEEIVEQVRGAYDHPYRSYGCGDEAVRPYCQPGCRFYGRRHPGEHNKDMTS